MSEAAILGLAVMEGAAIGVLFFAGLWWTVKRLGSARRPGLLLGGSLLIRMGSALGGFYLAVRAGWFPLLACLAGFILARIVFARLIRPEKAMADPASP